MLLFLGLIFLFSQKSENFQSRNIDETELQVLKEIVLADTIPTVYYKTTVSDLNQPLSRHVFYLRGFDICNALVNLDSLKLDSEDINYLVERFSTMESENINKLIREPKNPALKKLEGSKWFVISLPVVFRNGKYAIYYAKGAYGGQFILMKNTDGSWNNICSSTVWVE